MASEAVQMVSAKMQIAMGKESVMKGAVTKEVVMATMD